MIHKTNTENKIDFPEVEEKIPEVEEKPDPEGEYVDALTRYKREKALKKEQKKVTKVLTGKFGDVTMAKRMVKQATKRINTRRNSGRGR
jgi:hypothetical protein